MNVTVCDICGSFVSRVGRTEDGYVGVGATLVNACFDCQTKIGEFIADLQDANRPDTVTVDLVPITDFAARRRDRDTKLAEVEVES